MHNQLAKGVLECTDEFSSIFKVITESIVHFLSGLGCNGLIFAQLIPTRSKRLYSVFS